ncbi:hypothetical protein SAMN05192575_104245 [Nocardioides alpinus]|uniref:Uncharacterized protein n=1 Tax=Nocardioides alpinus TaxID=748909 RepID=A0A1I0YYE7_9ACTN|nr:hypothetical protein SAMN05192575_104245 [Nocardioides alpinus]
MRNQLRALQLSVLLPRMGVNHIRGLHGLPGHCSQASTLSWFSSTHFAAASSGDMPSSAM